MAPCMKAHSSGACFKTRAEVSLRPNECILETTETKRDMERAVSQLGKIGLTQGLFTTIIWKVMELKSCLKKYTRASTEKERGMARGLSLSTLGSIEWNTRWIS